MPPSRTPPRLRRTIRPRLAGFGVDLVVQLRAAGQLVRWIGLGAVVGILAGLSSAGFLVSLNWATDTRETHPWLLWLLPGAGLTIGLAYHFFGADSAAGHLLILDEIHEERAWIPRRMAPLVYVGTVVTHLFGGSAGREGTALQMSGSLTDSLNRLLGLRGEDRSTMLIAALSGGFGAVFGVPLAGCVFGLEVRSGGRFRATAVVPALTASIVGDRIVRALGVHHTPMSPIGPVTIDAALAAKVALAGVAFGLAGLVFAELTHAFRTAFIAVRVWPPLRPFIGGCALIALTGLVGTRDYLGLSVPLITDSLAGGAGVVTFAFALKLLFTAVTLGAGFPGGEVTPLFVIGATLGVTLGTALGVPVPMMAALGLVAVFTGAANVPLAGTVMGVELFGFDATALFAVVCLTSYLCSAHRGIYHRRPARSYPGRS